MEVGVQADIDIPPLLGLTQYQAHGKLDKYLI